MKGKKVDRVFVRDLKVFAYHGVLPREADEGQYFLIDMDIVLDLAGAARGDDLSSTVDYARVIQAASKLATEERHNLIETVAWKIADYLVSLDGVLEATVTVKKPEAPLGVPVALVGVAVTRCRDGG